MKTSLLNELFANAKSTTKLIFALFIVLISYLLITFITFFIALTFYPMSFEELNVLLKEGLIGADLSLLRLFQISQTIGLFIVPSVLLNYLLFQSGKGFISGNLNNLSFYPNLIVLFTLIFSLPVVQYLINWNGSIKFHDWFFFLEEKFQQMEVERNELTQRMTENMTFFDYFFNLIMIAVLPAIGEEFLFRGVVQKIFQQWIKNSHISIFIAAVLFSAIHLQFFGFFPRLLLGIYFGYLFFWSKNIWLAVWAHFLNNTLAISFLYFSTLKCNSVVKFIEKTHFDGFVEVLLSTVISGFLIILTYQYFRKDRLKNIR